MDAWLQIGRIWLVFAHNYSEKIKFNKYYAISNNTQKVKTSLFDEILNILFPIKNKVKFNCGCCTKLLCRNNAKQFSIPDSDFINSGYRNKKTFYECLKSHLYLHNQTMNMWTSLLYIFINIGLAIYIISFSKNMPNEIKATFLLHGFGRGLCWLFSWTYHTFNSVDLGTSRFLAKLDYVGCLLTTISMGTNFLTIELFNNKPIKIIFVLLGAIANCAAIPFFLMDKLQIESYRYLRAGLFLIGILSYTIPILFFRGFPLPYYYIYLVLALVFECIAGYFYSSKFPEKYFSSLTTDMFLSSHMLWHYFNLPFDILIMYFCYNSAITNKLISFV